MKKILLSVLIIVFGTTSVIVPFVQAAEDGVEMVIDADVATLEVAANISGDDEYEGESEIEVTTVTSHNETDGDDNNNDEDENHTRKLRQLTEDRVKMFSAFQDAKARFEFHVDAVKAEGDTDTDETNMDDDRRDYVLKAVQFLHVANERRMATEGLDEDVVDVIDQNVDRVKAFENKIKNAKSEDEIREHIDTFKKDDDKASQVKVKVLGHYLGKLERAIAKAEKRGERIERWIDEHTMNANDITPTDDSIDAVENELSTDSKQGKAIVLTEVQVEALKALLKDANEKLTKAQEMIDSLENRLINQDVTKEAFAGVRKDLIEIKDMIKDSYPKFREIIKIVKAL
jgi:hypothetical protein